jgi:hypothetical protein
MPREIPPSTLLNHPHWDSISKPMSELNWRYVSVQTGLGKNVQVGQEAGKSVQACIAAPNPVKGAVERLRAEEVGVKENLLPVTLSPRVPAPAVDERMMGKGARRSVKKLEEDKENLPTDLGTLKRRGTVVKKSVARGVIPAAFMEEEEPVKVRKMAPPLRKPSRNVIAPPVVSQPAVSTRAKSGLTHSTLSQRVLAQREDVVEAEVGPKRTLSGTNDVDALVRPPTRAEINVPSRVPARIQAQRATLKRSDTNDNVKQVTHLYH